MLTDRYGNLDITKLLGEAGPFAPFPHARERKAWQAVRSETRRAWVEAAEGQLDFQWPALPAGRYLHFERTGENLSSLHRFWERRSALGILAVAECMEGRGRFLDQIVSGIYTICEETAWLTPFDLGPFHEAVPAPEDVIVNLVTSETGALLAWVGYLFGEWLNEVSPRIRARIISEIDRRLVEPYLIHDDYWWMGFVPTPRVNNWNPWCNRNMLMCFLLLPEIGEKRRAAGIKKAMRSLDGYLLKYPPDGCCDEGPMYWGAAGGGLHTCLELLKAATGGVVDIFDEPIVQDIGKYFYKAHIHGDWFVDFADGDAHVQPGATAYRYGLSISDENLKRLGASGGPSRPVVHGWFGMYEHLLDIFTEEERARSNAGAPYVRDAWLWHTGVMAARERQGSAEGLFLAAKAGHNGEAHNHNDVGNFIVYADGHPVLVDLGTEEYSAKTFSPQRFELWYLQSQYHNCPSVGGVMQRDGRQFAAKDVEYTCDEHVAEMKADIAGAYPSEAGIEYWRRACRLNRGECPCVEVADDYALASPASVRWSLMTPVEPHVSSPGSIKLEYAPGRFAEIAYDAEALGAKVETIGFMESRLRGNWGDVMYRVLLSEKRETARAVRKISVKRLSTHS